MQAMRPLDAAALAMKRPPTPCCLPRKMQVKTWRLAWQHFAMLAFIARHASLASQYLALPWADADFGTLAQRPKELSKRILCRGSWQGFCVLVTLSMGA